jgi:hypothetical protein
MDKLTRTHLDHIQSKDKELQNKAYFFILNVTESASIGRMMFGMKCWRA